MNHFLLGFLVMSSVKFIGPAFVQVALKYNSSEANITRLGNKIKNGGEGVWGKVPMSPHFDCLIAI